LPAALLLAAAHPAASLAAALAGGAAAPGADPDTGYWVELGLVTLVTAAAGILMKLRNKPEP